MAEPGITEVEPARTWFHLFARWMVQPLVGSFVTPNHLTALRLLTGVASAGAFALGTSTWANIGGVLFVFSTFLDRADGELARISAKTSAAGHRYDLFSDAFSNIAVFIGIGIGLRESFLGLWAPWLGVLAGLAVGAIFFVIHKLDEAGSEPDEAFNYPDGFDFDDALFLIGPITWLGGLLPLLIASAIGTPVFLGYTIWCYGKVKSGSLHKPSSR